jgi:hypothetical protein
VKIYEKSWNFKTTWQFFIYVQALNLKLINTFPYF